MASSKHPLAPAPTFLCQPTGGGKSLVRDAFAAGRFGISWCIGPLLALGADQESKINKRSISNDGRTFAIHLDAYRSVSQQTGIWTEINKYSRQSNLSVVILSSPQVIQQMFLTLLNSGSLQQLCIDEAHLFVQFGLYFRDEFLQLKEHVFQKCLRNKNRKCTKIPVLFMTAKATKTILDQLERLTGFEFDPQHVFWPPAPLMLEPKVRMSFQFTP
jgi:superfamily II DNA helicase RecQ